MQFYTDDGFWRGWDGTQFSFSGGHWNFDYDLMSIWATQTVLGCIGGEGHTVGVWT